MKKPKPKFIEVCGSIFPPDFRGVQDAITASLKRGGGHKLILVYEVGAGRLAEKGLNVRAAEICHLFDMEHSREFCGPCQREIKPKKTGEKK